MTFFGTKFVRFFQYLRRMPRILFFMVALPILLSTAKAQGDCDSSIYISGKVLSENGRPLFDAMVINRTQQVGRFCESDGSFFLKACPTDSFYVSASGFIAKRFSYRDSVPASSYTIEIRLKALKFELPQVEVLAPRDLEAIQADINRLGFDEKDYRVSGINAFESPITFLYEAFSKRERSKREVMELRNNDRRRELLKELFAKYVEYEILVLDDHEFDAFIDFMDPGDEQLKRFSQYEFILYVKDRFEAYKKYGRKMKPSDFEYHLDD